jgi:hypothetical protein
MVVIHSLDPERHMAGLSKIYTSMFGHSFSPEHMFDCIDKKRRRAMLAEVPVAQQKVLRRKLHDLNVTRRQERARLGGVLDRAGELELSDRIAKQAKLASGQKSRREALEKEVLAQFGIKPWPRWSTDLLQAPRPRGVSPYIFGGKGHEGGAMTLEGALEVVRKQACERGLLDSE